MTSNPPASPTPKKTTAKRKAPKDLSTPNKLMKAQKALRYIVKDGRNEFAKYDYPTVDQYIKQCVDALLEADLVLTRTFDYCPSGLVNVHFCIYNPDDENGSMVHTTSLPVCARAGMLEDKAALATISSATSYYLQGIFMLPRVGKDATPELDQINDTKAVPMPRGSDLSDQAVVKINELCSLMGNTHSVEQVKDLCRRRAREAKVELDVAFIESCIEKVKGKNQ